MEIISDHLMEVEGPKDERTGREEGKFDTSYDVNSPRFQSTQPYRHSNSSSCVRTCSHDESMIGVESGVQLSI